MLENDLKYCWRCNSHKDITDFYTQTLRSGKVQVHTNCKACVRTHQQNYRALNKEYHNETTRQRRLNNKQQAIKRFHYECHDCRQSFPSCVYDFHHLDPSKKEMSVANAFSKNNKNFEAELDKCIMLCANCHRIRHHFREGDL